MIISDTAHASAATQRAILSLHTAFSNASFEYLVYEYHLAFICIVKAAFQLPRFQIRFKNFIDFRRHRQARLFARYESLNYIERIQYYAGMSLKIEIEPLLPMQTLDVTD